MKNLLILLLFLPMVCLSHFQTATETNEENDTINNSELRLVRPNGGEVLMTGQITEIIWEGITEIDSVILEYSTDNGSNWTLIDTVYGLKYNWEIPEMDTEKCLIKVLLVSDNYEYVMDKQLTFGGSRDDVLSFVEITPDGGYIVGGSTSSTDGDIIENKGERDAWVIKLTPNFEIEWSRTFGGSYHDYFSDVKVSEDSYTLHGRTRSNDGDFTDNENELADLICKLSHKGGLIWLSVNIGNGIHYYNDLALTENDGFIVSGASSNTEDSVSHSDVVISKFNNQRGLVWSSKFGGTGNEQAKYITNTSDGGYIILAETDSKDRDLKGFDVNRYQDAWVIKLDINGNMEWSNVFGGNYLEYMFEIIETKDGGYALVGTSNSNNGDIEENGKDIDYQAWILKIDKDGNKEWSRNYGGKGRDWTYSIRENAKGNFILVGYSDSKNASLKEKDEYMKNDGWLLILDEFGNMIQSKTYGGDTEDYFNNVTITNKDEIIISGRSNSTNLDSSNITNRGGLDAWITKFSTPPPLFDTSDAVFSIKKEEKEIEFENEFDVIHNNTHDIATVKLAISDNAYIELVIYDNSGRELETIYSGELPKGEKEFNFNLENYYSGRYYVNLITSTFTKTKFIEVLR